MLRRKARLSSSPLFRPETAVEQLAVEIQDYLHFPDPSPLYITLGAIAANMMCGRFVWLMLIGPPSSGKTELLMGMSAVPGMFIADDISGPGAFLSGTSKKELEKGHTGGLLRKIGPRGGIIMEDFTSTVMNRPSAERDRLLDIFRGISKGLYERAVGTGGAKTINWMGRLGIVAGGTPTIDRQMVSAAQLGERWIYYRMPESDGFAESKTGLQDRNPREGANRMKEAIAAFFEMLELKWPCFFEGDFGCKENHEHIPEYPKRHFETYEYMRLIGMATLVSRMRGSVHRHSYSREIDDIPVKELPPRLANMLGQLYLGLELIGIKEKERWRLIAKVAFDSAPEMRTRVVKACYYVHQAGEGGVVGIDEAAVLLGCSKPVASQVIDELKAFGVVRWEKKAVVLTEAVIENLKLNWG